jgi:hypothetical protein
MLAVTLVLARLIAESGTTAMPRVEDDGVLLVKRHDVVIGDGCEPGVDAGVDDGGVADAPDAPDAPDAGPNDAGVGDGGMPDADADVDAGCEVIPGDAVTLTVQPRFSELTSGARFALLMVTPARPIVQVEDRYVFEDLAAVTATKVVVHETEIEDPTMGKQCSGGCGPAYAPVDDPPSYTPPGLRDAGLGDTDGGYTVDVVGPYEILRAQPSDTAELESWLANLGYMTLPADVAAVAPYIARGYTVVAIRVKVEGLSDGHLMPVSLTWPGTELRLPVALGSPAGGPSRETTVYVVADGRYELPGAAVPFAYPTSFGLEGFLTKNVVVLDGDSADPDDDPVAAYAGDGIILDTRDEYVEKHVPVRDCGDMGIGCGCRDCSASRPVPGDWLIGAPAIAFVLMRKRRRRVRTGS